MEIRNQGRGIHAREIPGLAQLRALPDEWYAFTNLELSVGPGQYREIDIVMVIDDRILLVDLKDWNYRITSADGRWFHDDRDMGLSPVAKIRGNAHKVLEAFKAYLREHNEKRVSPAPKLRPPFFQGIVVQAGRSPLTEIAPNERSGAFMLDDFLRVVRNKDQRLAQLGTPLVDESAPLIARNSPWRILLERFFNAAGGLFKPGSRRYGPYRAISDQPTFVHRTGAYAEFEVEDESASAAKGLLRRWDFSKLETRFQTETGRHEIAGRERKVIAYLNDRNPNMGAMILQPKVDDAERSVGYWEVFETRRRLKRLPEFVATESRHLSRTDRLELVRQFLARVKSIHELDAAHLDLGSHSVWLEAPSLVRVSHLLAARVPDIQSLGEHRYGFLSSGRTPGDRGDQSVDARSKDCFLAGVVAHHIVFDRAPSAQTVTDPPEWDRSADENGSFANLNSWFEKALAWDSADRFRDAGTMLDAFNLASAGTPSSGEILSRLERFRFWKTQRQMFSDLPCVQEINVNDICETWLTRYQNRPVVAKMWKRAAWGDQQTELPRVLDFLDKAETLRISPLPGCAPIRTVHWMPDAIIILRDWIDSRTLEDEMVARTGPLASQTGSFVLLKQLSELVVTLHKNGFAHGDLKPSNILVPDGEDGTPVLIDHLDFSAGADGDIVSTAYAPIAGGDRFCRDRYAITKITEKVFETQAIVGRNAIDLAQAIRDCRVGPPENGTLLPLIECLEKIIAPPVEVDRPRIKLSIKNAETGPLLADEGVFGLRFARTSPILHIRGASEEIGVRLDNQGKVLAGWRKALEQKQIARVSIHEFARIEIELEVRSSDLNDFEDLRSILDDARFQEAWKARGGRTGAALPVAQDEEPDQAGDLAEDALAEAIELETPTEDIDIPMLWQALISAEEEFSIEGTTAGESTYRRDSGRHVAAFELERGTLDFDREDKVFVERVDRHGTWRDLGLLDVERSRSTSVTIDASRRFPDARDGLIADETRLRFKSHFETTSRSRREAATSRILRRQSIVSDLVDRFDARSGSQPTLLEKIVSADEVKSLYGLNDTQADAFEFLTRVQPIGLLQGPPGTGKTRFIGALVHFALTKNLARNVLLASQSNDAVDNAAEAVLDLFDPVDGRPAIVRVGQEGSVSERLLPHHAGRVEASYKHRLQADLKNRMRLAARTLGIKPAASDQLLFVHQSIRPVLARYDELLHRDGGDASERLTGLRQTIVRMAQKLDISSQEVDAGLKEGRLHEILTQRVASEHSIENLDLLTRFAAISGLAKDFIGSVSTRERSFESFLAGTRQIVAGTCVGLGRSSLGLTKTPFDLVIVDEAARCTSSELAVPIQSARWIILVGDQAQLEPHHRPEVVSEVAAATGLPRREIVRSDFERMFRSNYGRNAGRQLTQQYRMLAPIGRMVSTSFYAETLTHERTNPVIEPGALPESLSKVVTWLATDNQRNRSFQRPAPDGGPSLINSAEADGIIALLKLWDSHRPFRSYLERPNRYGQSIGIICMYAAQRDLVRHRLRVSGLSETIKSRIVVGTVDSYQGKQNPIVILSLVRNNDDGPVEFRQRTITQGFMARPNRINVAISRAMDRLVIVGARTRWPIGGPMHRVAEAFERELSSHSARLLDPSRLYDRRPPGRGPARKAGKAGKQRGAKHAGK